MIFLFYGASAMNAACSTGILRGRPFGGVGVLIHKSLSHFTSLCGFHPDNRAIAIKYTHGDIRIIFFGVYFPSDRGSPDYSATICSIIGFIESVLDDNPGCKAIITGDFNFQCCTGDKGYEVFLPCAHDLSLINCDEFNPGNEGFTYFHEGLGHKLFIDHFFVQSVLHPLIKKFEILECGSNLSDHLPIRLCLSISDNITDNTRMKNMGVVQEFRWDKGDIANYYLQSGSLLNKIRHDFPCMQYKNSCTSNNCLHDIDIYYNEIVHCLMEAARRNIPKIPAGALKHY